MIITNSMRKKSTTFDYVEIKGSMPLDKFIIPPYYSSYLDGVLIPNGLLKTRIEQLANDIMDYYQDRPYIVLCVLKGSIIVFNELIQKISEGYHKGKYYNCVHYEFVKISSYVGTQSSGDVKIIGLDDIDITDKEILVVEDIIDTGLTMQKFLLKLKESSPKSIQVFSLLLKETRMSFPFQINYIGFVVPDVFVVGYGLDYNQEFRDLAHLCVVNQLGVQTFKKIAKVKVKDIQQQQQQQPQEQQKQDPKPELPTMQVNVVVSSTSNVSNNANSENIDLSRSH